VQRGEALGHGFVASELLQFRLHIRPGRQFLEGLAGRAIEEARRFAGFQNDDAIQRGPCNLGGRDEWDLKFG
jgi:hypothetical protein